MFFFLQGGKVALGNTQRLLGDALEHFDSRNETYRKNETRRDVFSVVSEPHTPALDG
jgi:hypothetical protein